ncbi:MAG TPA: ABC transporter transmembrane domain-containing protein, partial [Steroidobacteraceae bacterium]|nr:ABC transporter transmembrane domain-containing protein [Steroidobacteraceae bacterium]
MRGGWAGQLSSFGKDSKVLQQKIKPGTTRRTLAVAAPHSAMLLLFLVVVIASASISIANPLIYREIINEGILKQNVPFIVRLALMIAGLGVLEAALGLLLTYMATHIGAAVVLSLRTRLFEHVQGMPLAFFSRTQTGALVNRLVTDTGGARTAFTDVLSNVAGNAVTVALVVAAMIALSWRITLIVLVLLPLFVLPARYWGRRIQAVTRELYDVGAAMSSVMVERFNVAGALLAKLFGRPAEDVRTFEGKAAQLSQAGVKAALYG